MKPWRTLEEVKTTDGVLALRQRDERDFLLTIDGRVLMSTAFRRSEEALAKLAFERIPGRPKARVLTAGLGLGFTLRAILEAAPKTAHVEVAELHEIVVRWCKGPLATVNGNVVADPRVEARIGDVMGFVRKAARDPALRYDAIVLDLMEGPSPSRARVVGRFYGPTALAEVRNALAPGGVYTVWGESDDLGFVDLLHRGGFDARRVSVSQGGPRHVVYVAVPTDDTRGPGATFRRGGDLEHGGSPADRARPDREASASLPNKRRRP